MQVGEAVDEIVAGDMVVEAVVKGGFLDNEYAFVSTTDSILSLTPRQSILSRILQYVAYMLFYFCRCILGRFSDLKRTVQSDG